MTIPRSRSPRLGHYAWVVAGVTGLVLLGAAGVRTAPQVLILPLEHEFGWMRADVSFAVALNILWYGLGGSLGGSLAERFGVRRIMAVGLALIAAGMGSLLGMAALWQLHLFWGVTVGIGTGMLANVLGAVVAQRWFVKHRGLVVGAFGAASATGQLIFLPSMITLNASQGWRSAVTIVALVIAALIVPVILFMRERPGDVKLRPFGETPAALSSDLSDFASRTPLRQALRTRDFWLLAASFFICGYTTNGLIGTHLLPHTLEHGFSDQAAGSAIALMGALNIFGTLASGWLSDRFDNRWLLATYYGLRAISLALLPLVQDMEGLVLFAIFYGIDWMATVPATINLVGLRFGRASVGVLYGWIFFSHMVGAALAAYAGGALRDGLGNYTIAFMSAAVLGLVATGLTLGIRKMSLVPSVST